MLKVKLLRDTGDFGNELSHVNFPITVTAELENVNFPVIVEGEKRGHVGFDVRVSELNKHGAKLTGDGFLYFSLLQGECEVVEDDC